MKVAVLADAPGIRSCAILYVEGPGDIVAAFDSWNAGVQFPGETSVTYSSQLFQHCHEQGLSFVAVSYGGPAKTRAGNGFAVMNLPRRTVRLPKIGYDLALLLFALRIARLQIRLAPRRSIVTAGVVQWWVCRWLGMTGSEMVPVLHNALWPSGTPPPARMWALSWWRSKPPRTLVVSSAIRRQVESLSTDGEGRVIEFRPTFVRAEFPIPVPHARAKTPFRILFAGRIERDKGALDLVEIAAALRHVAPFPFVIDVCGDGSAAAELDEQIDRRALSTEVVRFGRLGREALVARYALAHVCVVPTRGSFSEGFAQVVAEAILLGCPVVTSPVVPASEIYPEAIVLAGTDDVVSYVNGLLALMEDPERLERLAAACAKYRDRILDEPASFKSALDELERPE